MSWNFRKTSALVWLGLGLLAGLLVAGFWPSVPLHAVATDKIETFSMATGPVEAEYEAVYFLDHLTGDLHAYVIGRMANGGFGVLQHCYRNVLQDFKTEGDKTPKFLMATGVCDLNRARSWRSHAAEQVRALYCRRGQRHGRRLCRALQFDGAHRRPTCRSADGQLICGFPIRKVLAPCKKGKTAE